MKSIDPNSDPTDARERMLAKTEKLCAAQVPGDTHRDLRVNASFSAQTFKHILRPGETFRASETPDDMIRISLTRREPHGMKTHTYTAEKAFLAHMISGPQSNITLPDVIKTLQRELDQTMEERRGTK